MKRRYTMTVSDETREEFNRTARRLGDISLERAIVHSSSVGVSMIHAEKELGLSIILRDKEGKEWLFSVDTPGSAKAIQSPKTPPDRKKRRVEGNILYLDFGKKV